MKHIFTKSAIYAVLVAGAVGAWILTGSVTGSSTRAPTTVGSAPRSEIEAPDGRASEQARMRVTVLKSRATAVTRQLGVSAQTAPNRSVELRAETDGRIVELQAERGSFVASGAEIARLDMRDRAARLSQAEALIAQYSLQHEAAQRLRNQNLMSEAQVAEAQARLVGARAELAEIELEIANTQIRAPFAAMIQDRAVEIGDYVQAGDAIATLVDTDPLIVEGTVSEREIGTLAIGQTGAAVLADGRQVTGEIRYIAPVASSDTRTFAIELAVPNPDGELRAGISAQLNLAASDARGHLVSPSVLTLDDFGRVGVTIVDADDRARFYPVEMLSSGADGIWVAGLPDEVRLISTGQGFVTDGQLVEPVMLPPAQASHP